MVVRQIADRILADEYHTKFYGSELTDRTAPECGHLYYRLEANVNVHPWDTPQGVSFDE